MGDEAKQAGWMQAVLNVTVGPQPGAGGAGTPAGEAPVELASQPGAGGAGAGASWTPPFDLPACAGSDVAGENLVLIKNMLQDYKPVGFKQEMDVVEGALVKQMEAMTGTDRPLKPAEVTTLTVVGLAAQQAMKDALRTLVGMLSAELDKYGGADAAGAEDAAAELIHQEFRKGDGANTIADLKAIVEKTKKMGEEMKGYVKDAQQAKSVIKAAAKLEVVSKTIEGFTGKLGKAADTLQVASDLATLAGKVSQKPSSTANDINTLRSGLNVAGFILSKANVPLLGTYWTEYVKPCAEKCFEMLQKLDDLVDKSVRQRMAEEWWEQASKGGSAPSITDSGLNGVALKKVFPAGQPMLDFMWSFFRGSPPTSAPASVTAEFMKFRKQYNAGVPEAQQLKSDASWTNAWNLFGKDDSPNLLSWVAANKTTVWAMQYGSLPHP